MSRYDQRSRNELLRDVRDAEMGKGVDARLYNFLLSVPVLCTAAAILIYCFIEGFAK
jgi:hypothetical protein